MKQWLIIGAIIIVLLGSFMWNRNREPQNEDNIATEEIITQDDGKIVKKNGDIFEELSESEMQAKKKEITDNVVEANPVRLKAEKGQIGSGVSAATFKYNTYYQSINVEGMAPLQKGFFYEGWIEKEDGTKFSIGRIEMSNGNGVLYYSTKDNKSDYKKVVISRKTEGLNNLGEIVLISE